MLYLSILIYFWAAATCYIFIDAEGWQHKVMSLLWPVALPIFAILYLVEVIQTWRKR